MRAPATVPWLISPVAVASLYALGLAYGLTNVLFWVPGYGDNLPAGRAPDFAWLSRTVLLAMVGASAMWAGFHSGFGIGLGRALTHSRLLARTLRTTYDIRWGVFWFCIGAALVSRVMQVRLGYYGVLGDAVNEGASFRQLLNYGASLGLLALLGISARTFSEASPSVALKVLLGSMLVHECVWGALAADKSKTVMPVIVVGIIYYAIRQKLQLRYLLLGAALLGSSYIVLMPLRKMADEGERLNTRSVASIGTVVLETASTELVAGTPAEGSGAGIGLALLQRLNETGTASIAIRYSAEVPEDRFPDRFALDILLAPVYSFVPRSLWPDKPTSQEVGRWFYGTVLGGHSRTTLSGPTIVGYLNFAGGFVAIVLGFGLIGILQRGVHDRFTQAIGGGALVVMLGMLDVLGDLPSQFGAIVAQPFRTVPLLLLAQAILFRR